MQLSVLAAAVLALAGSVDAAPAPRAVAQPIVAQITKNAKPAAAHKRELDPRDLSERATELLNWNRDYQYDIDIQVGTPGQTFSVVLDTGSPDLWVMDSSCTTSPCEGQPRFNRNESTSYEDLEKPFSLGYGSGGVKGAWGKDHVSLDGNTFVNQELGLVNDTQIALFKYYRTQGILGLGWQVTPGKPKPVWRAILEENDFPSKAYGIYLERDLRPRNFDGTYTNAPGGEFMLGGYNTDLFEGDLNWVPVVPMNKSYWTLKVDGINVNGNEVKSATGNNAFVDSGTSMVYGSIAQVKEFWSQVPGVKNQSMYGSTTYNFPCEHLATMDVKWTFNGVAYPIYPGDLVYDRSQDGKICYGTVQGKFLTQALGVSNLDWILGAAFLKNMYTAYRLDPPAVGMAVLKDSANHKDPKVLSGEGVPSSSDNSTSDAVVSGSSNTTGPILVVPSSTSAFPSSTEVVTSSTPVASSSTVVTNAPALPEVSVSDGTTTTAAPQVSTAAPDATWIPDGQTSTVVIDGTTRYYILACPTESTSGPAATTTA